MSQSKALVDKRGSIQESQKQRGITFAQAFLSVDALLIFDTSSSMITKDVDGEGGKVSRHEEAGRQLSRLQARFPGRIAVVSFNSDVEFRPDGTLPPPTGGTAMLRALQFVQPAAGCGIRFIVCSDGEPDMVEETLQFAESLKTRIDAIHIGSSKSGHDFMQRLASCSGGQSIDESVLELEAIVTKLLSA